MATLAEAEYTIDLLKMIEAEAETGGWDALPTLWAIELEELAPELGAFSCSPFPGYERLVQVTGDPSEAMIHLGFLWQLTALTDGPLPKFRNLVALILVNEGWRLVFTEGMPRSELPKDFSTNKDAVEQRIAVFCGLDGSTTGVARTRGGKVEVMEGPINGRFVDELKELLETCVIAEMARKD